MMLLATPSEGMGAKQAPAPAPAPEMGAGADVFEIVGGGEKGGVVVRESKEVTSAALEERLATGSMIKVLQLDSGRASYELLSGFGPATGWISTRAAGRDLIARAGESSDGGRKKEQQEALEFYGKRLSESHEVDSTARPGFHRTAFPIYAGGGCTEYKPTQMVRAELERDLGHAGQDEDAETRCSSQSHGQDDVDSDGEGFVLCHLCRLPLGQTVYAADEDRKQLLHAECQAQVLVSDLREHEKSRRRMAADVKRSRHEQFEIGWKPEMIPHNERAAGRLACGFVPRGLCCLVWRDDDTVEVAPTLEPASAVNLEYLSLALQVRRCEGTEPLFSLDPIQSDDPEVGSMQMKVFEPEWLAGTSVGEVMFQADYHLKELSMGEYEQPIVGMKSSSDISDMQGNSEEWSGREWFIVRKAEIHVSDDSVVIPFLKMGVEAREQVTGPNGLEDAPVTRSDHPLVKYAEAFTRNFDLICERKGVIYQLREVAKASILAKYLLESGLRLDEGWFEMAAEPSPTCCIEVPQLWNDHLHASISVQDGRIVQSGKHKGSSQSMSGIYGGVDFGIDRFRLATPSRVATSVMAGRAALGRPASTLMATTGAARLGVATSVMAGRTALGRPASTLMAASAAGLSVGPARQFTRLAGPLSTMSMAAPSRLSAPMGAMSMAAPLRSAVAPQGVDLNLDKFNLSAPSQVGSKVTSSNANSSIGSAFWLELSKTSESALSDEDKNLFRQVFNPCLSDRRAEGELFAPPPTGYQHIQSLRRLLKEEESVRQRRKEHFFSSRFAMESAGPLFPSSWTSSLQASVAVTPGLVRGGSFTARPEFKAQADMLRRTLQAATPIFDRRAEDGMRFRIYRFGTLEVRTTQEHAGEEVIGVVFSVSSGPALHGFGQQRSQGLTQHDRLVKVTEYVERAQGAPLSRGSYVVFETEAGHSIVTEKLHDGTVAWKENPADLELRSSLAKVVRSTEHGPPGVKVGDMKKYQITQNARSHDGASVASCKRYAQLAFCKAAGEASRSSGFLPRGRRA